MQYGLDNYLYTYINNLVFQTKSQRKHINNKSVFAYEQSQWDLRVSSDNDFDRFYMIHMEISVASIYKDSGIKDKSLISHIARLWVMKPFLQRTCHLFNLIVRDILKHLECDCICKRALVNSLLESIQFKVGIDDFIELAFCSKEKRVIKMLSWFSKQTYHWISSRSWLTSGLSLY